MESGKKRRLKRILRDDNRTVIVPMDHGVTIGPVKGLVNMQGIVDKLLLGGVDAVVINRGIAKSVDTGNAGLIVHLFGSTKHCPDPNSKVQICSVADAVRLGADAVSVHVNVGAEQEAQMLSTMGKVACECDDFGMPLLAMMYPRGPSIKNQHAVDVVAHAARLGADAVSVHINIGAKQEDRMLAMLGNVACKCDDYGMPLLAMMYPRGPNIKDQHAVDVVAHAARLGAELGADIVKTNYTGDAESFKKVVSCCHVPVIIAGGPKVETVRDVLQMVSDSLKAGGAGVSIGRNVFQHENPAKMVKAISALVHRGASVSDALKILGE